jgi:glycerophosphoryl diester phosphodiesterase
MKKFHFFCMIALISLGQLGTSFAQPSGKKLPKVIAHRGYWDTPGSSQNSIASLIKADSIGCYGTEFDVWLAEDQVLILNHDASYKGFLVEKTVSSTLMEQQLSNGENLPGLEQFFKAAENLKIRLVLELKPHSTPEREILAVELILELVKSMGLEDRVDYISFSKNAIREFAQKAPNNASVQYLGQDLSPQELFALGIRGADYNYSVYQKNPTWLAELKSMQMVSNVWTVNKSEQMQWCIDHELDFITTDAPELYKSLITSKPELYERF